MKAMNVEARKNMIPAHIGLFILVTGLGPQVFMLATKVGQDAEQFMWLSALISGLVSFVPAYLIIKICLLFSSDKFVEIASRVLGKTGGLIVISHFIILLFTQLVLAARICTNVAHLFLFDRTPPEVIALVFISTAVYCAMQEWNTQLGVIQLLTLTGIPVMYGGWLLSFLSFQPENLLPLWPEKPLGILQGALDCTSIFAGNAIIFILLPLINKSKKTVVTAAAWGIGILTLIYILGGLILVGVLTANTIKVIPYPTIIALKGVELPGVFIERIENYMLLSWLPIVTMNAALYLFCLAETLRLKLKFTYHRGFVPVLLPLILITAKSIDTPQNLSLFISLAQYISLLFFFVTVPILWILARKKAGSHPCTTE